MVEAVNDYILEECVVLSCCQHFFSYFDELLLCEVHGNDRVVHINVIDSDGLLLLELYVLNRLVPNLDIAVCELLYLLGSDNGARVLNSLLVGVDDLLLGVRVGILLNQLFSLNGYPLFRELGYADEIVHSRVVGRDISRDEPFVVPVDISLARDKRIL